MTLTYFLYCAVTLAISATVLAWTVQRIATGRIDPREDLPLDLCNLSALIAPIHLFAPLPLLAAWSICVGGPGGIVSILTPDLTAQHDRATHIKFWVVHYGLVLVAPLLALQVAPQGGTVLLLQLLGAVAALLPVAILANRAFGANYLFLRHRPVTASLLDAFGRWPLYLAPMIVVAAAAIALAFGCWSLWWSRA